MLPLTRRSLSAASRTRACTGWSRTGNIGNLTESRLYTSSASSLLLSKDVTGDKRLYLHVGPAGDCWTGSSIFAAKHLQPDYVKSVVLPNNLSTAVVDAMLDVLESDPAMAHEIYDTQILPENLLERVQEKEDVR
jgi:hypothetical protein